MSTFIWDGRRRALLLTIAASISVGACSGPAGDDDGGPIDGGSQDGGSLDGGSLDGTAPLPDGAPGEDSCVPSRFYADGDGDGYGDPAASQDGCEQPAGHVTNADDCDDTSPDAHPGGVEVCDGLDNDCDGQRDDGYECVAGETTPCTTTCGSTGTGTCTASCMPPDVGSCTPPVESCNVVDDDDCDGLVDEGVGGFFPTERGSFGAGVIYDAPTVSQRPNDGGAISFWLRGSDLYGFWHDAASATGWSIDSPSELLIATGRARYHVSSLRPYVAYVDATGSNQGEIVVSKRLSSTLAEDWRHRITTPLAGGQLYTDVRVLGEFGDTVIVFARHRDGQLRLVHLDRATGAETQNTLLLAATTGPFSVSGNDVRWVAARTFSDATRGSIDILAGGTAGSLTRQVDLGASVVPRDVVVTVDNSVSPANAMVVWSELGRDGRGDAIRYAWFPGLTSTPVLGVVSANTTPFPAPERHYFSMDLNAGVYVLAAVEGAPVGTEGTPTLYKIYVEPEPRVSPIGALPGGAHRRISLELIGSTTAVASGFVFHNSDTEPGNAWTRFGCPP